VVRAREVAFTLVGDGDGLAQYPLLGDEVELLLGEEDEEFLLKG
jgi:hypothetical protein